MRKKVGAVKDKTGKKRARRLLLVVAIIIAAFICVLSFSRPADSAAKPAGGVLDLQNWHAERNGILNLIGEWDFYWHSFVTYQDIANNNAVTDLTVNAPSVWNSYKINGKNLPGYGYGSYRLKVINATVGQPLALRLPAFATSYELYVNDNLLASDGVAGTDKDHSTPGCKPQLAEFTPAQGSFEIIVHVANFTYAQGGMIYPIKLGTAEQIQRINKTIADQDLFLIGGFCVMAFFFMCIFLLRREDKFSLYFTFVCLSLAASAAISGDYVIFRLLPNISYDGVIKIMYIVLCWFPVSAAFAVDELFPKEMSQKVLRGLFVYAAVMTPFVILAPVEVYSYAGLLVSAVHILIDLYGLSVLTLVCIRGRTGTPLMLISCVGVMLCYAHDMVFYSGASRLAAFLLLLIMSFAIAKRLTEAYRTESDLSQKLLTLDRIKDETIAKALTAEAAFMQAQIKPHFLYNTLNTISSFCDTDPAQAGRLIDEFSDYLRQSFDFRNPEMLVPLEQELNLVKSYMEIEKVRFGDELYVRLDIDEALTTKIPLLSIQPLVENAINHGLRKKSGGGAVTLSVHRVTGGVEIAVRDDGQGISEDKQQALLLPEDGQGIGLWNIDRRLRTLYGKGLHIESEMGKGTAVSFVIPEEAQAND